MGHHERFLKLNSIVNWLNNTHADLQRSGSRESSGTCLELFNTSSALLPDSSLVCQIRGQIFLENAYRFSRTSWDIVSCRVFPTNQLHTRDPLRQTRTIESVSYCQNRANPEEYHRSKQSSSLNLITFLVATICNTILLEMDRPYVDLDACISSIKESIVTDILASWKPTMSLFLFLNPRNV